MAHKLKRVWLEYEDEAPGHWIMTVLTNNGDSFRGNCSYQTGACFNIARHDMIKIDGYITMLDRACRHATGIPQEENEGKSMIPSGGGKGSAGADDRYI